MNAAGISISDDLRRSVERRLLYGLSRFGPGVERVIVSLSDVANPLGGFDRRCHMEAWLRGQENVHVATMDGNLAIDRAVGRLVERVEWALVNGRADGDSPLAPEAVRPGTEERPPSAAAPAGRGRRRRGLR